MAFVLTIILRAFRYRQYCIWVNIQDFSVQEVKYPSYFGISSVRKEYKPMPLGWLITHGCMSVAASCGSTETTCGDVTVNEATTLASLARMYNLLCHLGTIELPFEDTFMELLPKNQHEGCIKANEIVRINPCGYKTKYTWDKCLISTTPWRVTIAFWF